MAAIDKKPVTHEKDYTAISMLGKFIYQQVQESATEAERKELLPVTNVTCAEGDSAPHVAVKL